jgi:signal transduction histidine kinase
MPVNPGARAGTGLGEALERITLHDHCCLIYDETEEPLAAVAPFLRTGLERGEKCIYVADESPAEAILEALRGAGVDVEAAIRAGALTLASSRDTYLEHGSFDPGRTISVLEALTDAAIAAGFPALRVTGEMTWALGEAPGAERLLEYESKLARFIVGRPCVALCQYDRRRFSAEVLLGVIRTHPLIIHRGRVWQNFYYVPPEEFLEPTQAAREVERLLENIRARGHVEEELRRSRDELEARVRERTRQLEQANQALQAQVAERQRAAEVLRDSQAALQRTSEQLRALTAGLFRAQEEERRRLSRELHDDLNQKLAMLAVEAEALGQELPLGRPSVQDRLSKLLCGVNGLSDDVHRIAYQLHPPILDHLGLAVALKSYCQEFSRRFAAKVKFIRRDLPEAIPHEVALCLFRVTQEGLRNIARHSRSERATVVLSGGRQALRLSITDFGVGFDPEAMTSESGLGLISMEERVRLAGGSFAVWSRSGGGTRLEIRIPLSAEAT